jgi:hypothetical protein
MAVTPDHIMVRDTTIIILIITGIIMVAVTGTTAITDVNLNVGEYMVRHTLWVWRIVFFVSY